MASRSRTRRLLLGPYPLPAGLLGAAGWIILAWHLERERAAYSLGHHDYWRLKLARLKLLAGPILDSMGTNIEQEGLQRWLRRRIP